MPVPPTPSSPVLFGPSVTEREASRTANALRLDWVAVATATSYDVLLSATDLRPNAMPGSFLGGLAANQAHQTRVRAVNGDGPSGWSSPALFATRPDKPSSPFLQAPGADRRDDSLKLTWQEVNGVHEYELRVSTQEFPATVQTPFVLVQLPSGTALEPNEMYDVSIRACDDAGGGVSEWSDAGIFVTRPPKPEPPLRVSYDLFGWGIVVRWQIADTFNHGGDAVVRLTRTMDGTSSLLLNGTGVAGGYRTHRFVDSRLRLRSVKLYRLQTVVPAAATPALIPEDGGENRSFESNALETMYPIFMKALRPVGRSAVAGVARIRFSPYGVS